jgi:hypothetical protein
MKQWIDLIIIKMHMIKIYTYTYAHTQLRSLKKIRRELYKISKFWYYYFEEKKA